jgi:hypothetical protein
MLEELRGRLCTTVVGSFPYRVDRALLSSKDWSTTTDIRETAIRALRFQLGCGIEFPSDGQFFDMVKMYLDPLKAAGFLAHDGALTSVDPPERHPSIELESELEKMAKHRVWRD